MHAMASFKNIKEEPYVTLPQEEEPSNVSKFSHQKVVVASLFVGLLITGVVLTIYLVKYEDGSELTKTLKGNSNLCL